MAEPSALKGVLVCTVIGVVGVGAIWGSSGAPQPLASKRAAPPLPGIIGREDRVPLHVFAPDDPDRFPGWEDAVNAVVRISCGGGGTGGGVLIGDGSRMITAAHVFLDEDGTRRPGYDRCVARHPGGDVVFINAATLKSGEFFIPEALQTHLSVGITATDWAIVRLARVPQGARPLPLAGQDELQLEVGQPVLNIAGPQDNYETDGFLAQVCTYHGAPPTASALSAAGEIVGRAYEPGDEWRVARYDCDLGAGGSGSPIIGWHGGQPFIWGIVTDSLRGRDRCPEVGYASCYSAGPLATAMDVVE